MKPLCRSMICVAAAALAVAALHARQLDPVAVLATRASSLAAQDAFSGSMLIAQNGKVLLREGYGLADRERKIAARPDTKFRLGSMDKMFTAVAILQFVEQGKVGLDDPIGKYLTEYPNKELSSRVTIRHLLTHSGGTGDIFPEYVQRKTELKSHSDFMKMFAQRAPAFEPGTEHRYSNYGFILLGAIIESISGVSYYDHVAAKVFAPAGMRNTDSPVGVPAEPGRAIGYVQAGTTWTPNTQTLPWRGTSAGGGYSTVDDLFHFASSLQDGTLIKKSTFDLATTPITPGSPHGLGFLIAGSGSSRAVGHSGGAPGMSGELRMFPATGHIFAALANHGEPGIAGILSREFRQAVSRQGGGSRLE